MAMQYDDTSMNMKSSKDPNPDMQGMDEMEPTDSSSQENLVYLPEGVFKKTQPGSSVSGNFEGVVSEKDGRLYIDIKTINGTSTAVAAGPDEEKGEMDMNAGESLDKYMAANKNGATQ